MNAIKSGRGPAGAASVCASAAHAMGKSRTVFTPFERDARAAGHGDEWRGGKLDDCTVVVGIVSQDAKL